MFRTKLAIAALVATAFSQAAIAGNFTSKNNLNHRPVDEIASELGVEPQQFADCFVLVSPAPDFKPTKAEERANKAKLLPCLQKANSSITNDQLDRVMDKYRGIQVN